MVKWPITRPASVSPSPDHALPSGPAECGTQQTESQLIAGLRPKLLYERFGISENPFGVTPNTRFLYESRTHAEARSSLIIGIECGLGFQALIAPPGMGKTTILFNVLGRFNKVARTAFLLQVHGNSCDFLRYLISELGGEAHDSDQVHMQETINRLLIRERRAGRQTIIVIDEAQGLNNSVLETVRLLSNFETSTEKLLHIIMAGQPQLAQKLADPEMAQLQQRISILTTLVPFNLEDTRKYIVHRLMVAGYKGPPLFTSAAIALIWERSGGVPREINTFCFNALLLASANEQKEIDADILNEVVKDRDLARIRSDAAASFRQPTSVGEVDWVESGIRAGEIDSANSKENVEEAVVAVAGPSDSIVGGTLVERAALATNRTADIPFDLQTADSHCKTEAKMTPNLKKQPQPVIAAHEQGSQLDQEIVEWFVQRGGVWRGTAAELLAEVKMELGVDNDLLRQFPRALHAHLESHREIFRSLGLNVSLQQGYPRMVSLRLCQDERAVREPLLDVSETNNTIRSAIALSPFTVEQKIVPIDFSGLSSMINQFSRQDPLGGSALPERFVNGDTAETPVTMSSQSATSNPDGSSTMWSAFKRVFRRTGS